MNKIIEVVVSPQGKTKIETRGFIGAECREASKFLKQALGPQTGEQLKAEFHQGVHEQNSAQHRA